MIFFFFFIEKAVCVLSGTNYFVLDDFLEKSKTQKADFGK